MNQPKVIYSDRGLANYYGEYIQINRALRKDKALRDFVIKHELGHSKSFDLGYEVFDGLRLLKNPKMGFKLLKFYFSNPSTWSDLLPIQYEDKKLVYDLNLIILYGFIISIIYLSILFL